MSNVVQKNKNTVNLQEKEERKVLQTILDIGAQMLSSGAEISRVEESIERMGRAFGAQKVECFAITYVIVVTMSMHNAAGLTEIRRIHQFDRNMNKLTSLNTLSREICENKIGLEEANIRLEIIKEQKTYSLPRKMFIFALISLSFTLFFGGSTADAIVSACIGVAMAPVDSILLHTEMNRFVQVFLCAVVAGIFSIAGAMIWKGVSSELVSIGNIMIFIPGVIFTCGIQEIFSNNMLSGMTRFAEAVILSLVVATGFAFVNILLW